MTKPTVWITRTMPAAQESAAAWQRAGAEAIVMPLLSVEPVAHETPTDNTTLIFTSKNGVDYAPFRPANPVICVGDATAAHALESGYRNVVSVDGTSADVTAYVMANLPLSRAVTHISGQHVRGSITEDLAAAGYDARRIIVYRSAVAPCWPSQDFDTVALYSPLAAQAFFAAATGRQTEHLHVTSISEATDGELNMLKCQSRRVATRPTEAAMLALLKRGNGLG